MIIHIGNKLDNVIYDISFHKCRRQLFSHDTCAFWDEIFSTFENLTKLFHPENILHIHILQKIIPSQIIANT